MSGAGEVDLSQARPWPRGRGYHEFEEGDEFAHHWGRTITEADAVLFSTMTLATNPLYLNAEYARAKGHPGLVVDPYLVLSLVVGLSVEDLSELSTAFLGMDDVEFTTPVYPGDTITAHSTVIAKRRSRSKPHNGIVSWRTVGRAQDGREVISLVRANLFDAGAPDAAER